MKQGFYIVIEGINGLGKSTQINQLSQKLNAAGLATKQLREPDSTTDLTARTIRTITQDPSYQINTRTEVLLYNAARAQSLDLIGKLTKRGVSCLVDRNYLSTLAYQYHGRGDVDDYDLFNSIINFAVGEMEPDLTIVLDAPVKVVKQRTKQRYQGERFDNLDDQLLERIRQGYLIEAKSRGLPVIDASSSIEDTTNNIWKEVIKLLKSGPVVKHAKPLKAPAGPQKTSKSTNPFITKLESGRHHITDEGKAFLEESVTDSEGDVYVFKDKLSNATVAAAMARLSRRFDDMRITILDEFAMGGGKDEGLLRRVITAYGDDSVQQLAGLHLVVENASNLLTKKLEWGRLAAYLEQSTRYIYFDEKDESGRYRYFTPTNLDKRTTELYEKTINTIFDLYSDMVYKLTDYVRSESTASKEEQDGAWKAATRAQACDVLRAVLPVATKSTVGIYASGQALENMIMNLQADPLLEARETGDAILEQARKVTPVFLERADRPDRGGATVAYRANTKKAVRGIAKTIGQGYADATQPVELSDFWPKNELELLPHMLYEHTDLSLKDVEAAISSWNYEQKQLAFKTYLGERLNRRHKPGRALENAHYVWDLVCDYGAFRDLQRHRMVDDMQWQELTPRYGYDVPELIEQAGLEDDFQKCFDLSFKLHSALVSGGYELEAQYATLLGHLMRWKVTFNAREAYHWIELRTSPHGHSSYRKLTKQMYDKLAEVHPLLAEGMIFVNQDEDPELARLAAEKYSQFKLEQLDNQVKKK